MIKICFLHTKPQIAYNIIVLMKNRIRNINIDIKFIFNYKYELDNFIRDRNWDILIINSDYIKANHDGIYVAKRVKVMNRKVLIIFISLNGQDNLIDIIYTEPFAYILANELKDKFLVTLEKAISIIEKDTSIYSYVKRREFYQVSLKNVIYFTSAHRTIEYLCINGKTDTFYGKMDNVEKDILTISKYFLRANQSYLINAKYILTISQKEVTMVNGDIIIISRKYHNNLEVFRKFLNKEI